MPPGCTAIPWRAADKFFAIDCAGSAGRETMALKLGAERGLNGRDCPGIAGAVAHSSITRLAGSDREIR
jgi:hypothetical protein